ncbi:CADN-like protein [Mya arenaria]|uniref:CADN-like protein n=1 Tax=Mya arenaria TaxID=6604 RepID=A0ABY7FB30_MYAAR|nr:CADN-like protein [Mya arenaria]
MSLSCCRIVLLLKTYTFLSDIPYEFSVDGVYTLWSSWDACSMTCGEGAQSRSRTCTTPEPQYGGLDCIGDSTESQSCNDGQCPIDGGYTLWSDWDACSVTCGDGTQSRSRTCSNPEPQYGGLDCVGDSTESQPCNGGPCPIDGGFTPWSSWDACSATCSEGTQSRSRTCTNPEPQYGGLDCVGDSTESHSCNDGSCPVDGGYTVWSSWDACSMTCGDGTKSRSRTCTNPEPQYGGLDCIGVFTESQSCNDGQCPSELNTYINHINTRTCLIDGTYTLWSAWDACSMTCGDGTQSRSRSCTNLEPQYGGLDCVGDTAESQPCTDGPCPIMSICRRNCVSQSNVVKAFDQLEQVSLNYLKNSCALCIVMQEVNNLDGEFSLWSSWGSCTVTCGDGTQFKSRTCTYPEPQYGGLDCVGDSTESRPCNDGLCPVDGSFTLWNSWGACSMTCGDGAQSRSRTCTDPEPRYGGLGCVGESAESQPCNDGPCPIFSCVV